MVMQSAFFKLANIIPIEDAVKYLKDSIEKLTAKYTSTDIAEY